MRTLALVILSLFLSACIKKQPPPQAVTAALTAEQVEEAWKLAGSPGKEHKLLESLVGDWDGAVKFWTSPMSQAEVSKSKSHNTMELGSRFVKEEYQGVAGGRPFTGMGLVGFNNISREFESIWIDSMSTAMMLSSGTYDPLTRTLNFKGEYTDPVSGKRNTTRSVETFLNDHQHVFEMFDVDENGKEYRSLEIFYTKSNYKRPAVKGKVTKKAAVARPSKKVVKKSAAPVAKKK